MNERTPKGWCPTTRKPMPSGDGLLMRLKPQRHTISLQDLEVICDAATAFGSSMIALTNRANLQIRGLDEASYAQLIQRCIQADIIPQDTPIYEDLNLLVSPLWEAGDSHCAIADELTQRCAELPALPAKFGFCIDLGAVPILRAASADIRLERTADNDILLLADGAESGIIVTEKNAVDKIIALAHYYITHKKGLQRRMARFVRDGKQDEKWQNTPKTNLSEPNEIFAPGNVRLGTHTNAENHKGQFVGIPLGRIDAQILKKAVIASGASAIRLTPFNLLLLEGVHDAACEGLITDKNDPLLSIKACVGAPYCSSGFINTTDIAQIAKGVAPGLIHISGCGKGCAHPNPAALTIAGQQDKIHIIKEGYAWDDPVIAPIQPEEINNLAHILSPAEPVAVPQDETVESPFIVAGTVNEKGEYLYDTDGGSIYLQSFAMIRAEAELARFSPEEEQVAVRMIHAAGLVELAPFIHFSPDFVSAARKALMAGAPIFCDARMVSEGITPARLPANNDIICTLHDERTRPLAAEIGNTRSAAALELWRDRLEGAVVAIGNAPTALFHLLNMLKQPDCPRPAAIIGCPVGFVGAAESKQALFDDYPTPFCIVSGRLGGSAITVAAVNAVASTKE